MPGYNEFGQVCLSKRVGERIETQELISQGDGGMRLLRCRPLQFIHVEHQKTVIIAPKEGILPFEFPLLIQATYKYSRLDFLIRAHWCYAFLNTLSVFAVTLSNASKNF